MKQNQSLPEFAHRFDIGLKILAQESNLKRIGKTLLSSSNPGNIMVWIPYLFDIRLRLLA